MPRTVSNAPKILLRFIFYFFKDCIGIAVINDHWSLNSYTHQVIKYPENFKQPDDNNDYNDNVQNVFDFAIHGDVGIDEPKNNTCCN